MDKQQSDPRTEKGTREGTVVPSIDVTKHYKTALYHRLGVLFQSVFGLNLLWVPGHLTDSQLWSMTELGVTHKATLVG